ncbi:carbohydrate-binding module family 20 domain-containing protein [Streptomyces sp. CB03911]|uniref:carbohydrate-binding module family 20 domain-containing protein n=1 Tax=Streptomycetaceae TaxID=2062 RepID=UPI00256FD97F|nr:carbohydrate-binding module family 20 domain-containing protein [Streptomyces sp. CB03911]
MDATPSARPPPPWSARTSSWSARSPALGSWAPASAVPRSSTNYPTWSATVALPADTAFEYKHIVKDAAGPSG